jgi:hypothetical protein
MLLKQIQRKNVLLWRVGILHLALTVASLTGLVIDARTVGGINPWIKPIKFDLSITVFLWTMAWVLAELPQAFARRISRDMAATMLLETLLIGMQAARGVKSHFNADSAFDSTVFAVMVVVILYNFWLLIRVTLRFFRSSFTLPRPYIEGLRLGLLSLLVGNVMGVFMSTQKGHAVGVVDGGPGLLFFNWATNGGDLRVAHFLGLHGIQLMIFVGSYVSRPRTGIPEDAGLNWVRLCFVVQVGLTVALFLQGLYGFPFIGRG